MKVYHVILKEWSIGNLFRMPCLSRDISSGSALRPIDKKMVVAFRIWQL